MKKRVLLAIRILVAIMFLFSAYAKIYPSANLALGTFEAKQLIPMGFSEGFAPYFSRFLISTEFAIGIGLLQAHFLKRFVVPTAILLLTAFCIQLTYELSVSGNNGNCGCFGSLLPMTPFQALIKNIVAIGLLVYLWKMLPGDDKTRNHFTYPMLIFTSIAALIYAGAPIQLVSHTASTGENTTIRNADFAVEPISTPDTTTRVEGTAVMEQEIPKQANEPEKHVSKFSSFPEYIPADVRIDEGKKILCMFAPGCEHCQATAKQLTEMRSEIRDFPPIHIVFMDEETDKIPEFFEIAGRKSSYRIAPVTEFWKIIDFSRDTPGVCYL